jgi:UDP-N-acetylmuramate dehydrogenase
MTIFADFEHLVSYDEPMSTHTWMRLGGPAKYFIRPTTLEELTDVVRRCRDSDVKMFVLGRGANLLVDDTGVDGAVIHLRQGVFTDIITDGTRINAFGGADMGSIVLGAVRKGLSGIECLTGIPGSVGGCVRMNAGGAFGDVGSVIETVHVMNEDGEVFARHREDLTFDYRSTNISAKFILGAEFELVEDDPQAILRTVKQIWIHKKNSQPLSAGTAGCIFKNPRGLSAGALIDRAGLKGRAVGGAHVSEKHANFIIAETGASAADVLELINVVRETVLRTHEIYLELEVEVW